MSTRHVLGVVSQNVANTHKHNIHNKNKQKNNFDKQTIVYNDENKYAKQANKNKQNSYEFEIFEEDSIKCESSEQLKSSKVDKKNNKKLRESDPSSLLAACHKQVPASSKPLAVLEPTNKENNKFYSTEVEFRDDESKETLNISDSLPMLIESSMNSTSEMTCSPGVSINDTIKFQSFESSSISVSLNEDEEEDEEETECSDYTQSEVKRRTAISANDLAEENCDEYRHDIIDYMHIMEHEYKPKVNYMRKQQDINHSMRMILVDWLVEVSEEYRLTTETLYLSVNFVDRFLSQMSVLRGKLQLVGTAAMYIASKYEEITPPDVSEFVYITDDTYTRKQVLRMEHLMLKVLDFRVNAPTANNYMSHFLRFLKCGKAFGAKCSQKQLDRISNLARYICELTLIEGDTFDNYLPSQLAASALYLSLHSLGKEWTPLMTEECGYTLDKLHECIVAMHACMKAAPTHTQQAIQEKYKQSKYQGVSLIEPKDLPAFIVA